MTGRNNDESVRYQVVREVCRSIGFGGGAMGVGDKRNPTWSFLYRNIAKAMLEDEHRVVALDHIGMGMSDVPPTSEFDYRPRSHAAHLEDLVVALDLRNVTELDLT